jgi:hypothetical protein
MGLILYLPKENKTGSDLLRIVQPAISGQEMEIYSSLGELKERLHEPLMDVSVALLFAAGRAELMELVGLGDLLGELKVVLVLPDNQPEALEKAHSLRPRFIASTASDFIQLGSILKRMMNLYETKR